MSEALFKENIRRDFSRAAVRYEAFADLQKQVAERVAELALENFSDSDRLLDIGCGTGFLAQKLLSENANINIMQLDIAPAMCEIAARYAPVVNADMESMPFSDGEFDGVVSSLAMQWSSNFDMVFAEANRVLEIGKKFIFSIFLSDTLKEVRYTFEKTGYPDRINSFLFEGELCDHLLNNNFKIINLTNQTEVREYTDIYDLLRKIRTIGAANKKSARRNPLNKSALENINRLYNKQFGKNGSIPATWEVCYVVAEKHG